MSFFLGFLLILAVLIAIVFLIPSIRENVLREYKKSRDESFDKTYKAVRGDDEDKAS